MYGKNLMNDDQNKLDVIEPAAFARAEVKTTRSFNLLQPARLTLIGLFLLLGTIAVFLFTARAVEVNITPEPAFVDISTGFFSYQLGERYLMLPGDYTVRAGKEGYRILEVPFKVSNEASQSLEFELIKLPGSLAISTAGISGAEIYIDQQFVGTSPLMDYTIEAGLHDVSIRAPRYLPYDTEIEIEGMMKVQNLNVELAPAWAMVSISTQPPGASITVGQESLGVTPATVPILQGSNDLSLALKGFKSWQSSITVSAGEDQVLPDIELEKADGKILISSKPEGASITISGRYYGQTPLNVSLPPGSSYKIQATRAGYEPAERKLKVLAEQSSQVSFSMQPITGTVRLLVEPKGARLLIDGNAINGMPTALKLTAKEHEIRVEKTGFAPYISKILPDPEYDQQLVVKLVTEEQAEQDAIVQVITASTGNELKLILPGELTLGAPRREPGRRSNEVERDVELTRAFYLGITEVTNAEFLQYLSSHDSGTAGRSLLNLPDRPVVNITWTMAIEFCNWLSAKDGLPLAYERTDGAWQLITPVNTGYRLPTEAEWSWAARYADGSPTRFPWGNNMPPAPGSGNFADDSAAHLASYTIAGYNDTFRGPSPPGAFGTNTLGIADLAGNVAEWVNDRYGVNPSSSKLEDPIGPLVGDTYVIRGSSYMHGRFSELRWTFREQDNQGRPDLGFRLARYLE